MATLYEKIDKLVLAFSAQKLELANCKAENAALKQQIADAVAAEAADNSAEQAEAEAAAAKLDAELAELETGEGAAAAEAVVSAIDGLLEPVDVEPVDVEALMVDPEATETAPAEELVA
jgi:septal ring factor EnvC (AmiA/AmiB activator)